MCNDQYNRMYNLHSHTASGIVHNYENAARIKPESFKCIRSRSRSRRRHRIRVVLCALQAYFAYPIQVRVQRGGYMMMRDEYLLSGILIEVEILIALAEKLRGT